MKHKVNSGMVIALGLRPSLKPRHDVVIISGECLVVIKMMLQFDPGSTKDVVGIAGPATFVNQRPLHRIQDTLPISIYCILQQVLSPQHYIKVIIPGIKYKDICVT